MADTLRHRGPDEGGVWVDAEAGIALGHRRLAVRTQPPLDRQPALSENGNWVVVHDGEISNAADLRRELETRGHRFRGHSDTEVMLAAFVDWGVEASLKRFNGAFALAAWDRTRRTLYLARDRVGEKPLYYGWAGQSFLFGSELKALRAHPDFRAEIDLGSLALYFRLGYVPHPYAIYRGVRSLVLGSLLRVQPLGPSRTPEPIPYWSAREIAESGRSRLIRCPEEALEELGPLLFDAVKLRMPANVSPGLFLSGGIDSSLTAALMQAQNARPVKTFSIGFEEHRFNEAVHASKVAAHLGTDHTELYVTPADAKEVTPRLPAIYDEPFADSSQIPTYLVSRLARREVPVSFSGEGGDELFGGYVCYRTNLTFWRRYGWLPGRLRRLLSRGVRSALPARRHSWLAKIPRRPPLANAGPRLLRLGAALAGRSEEESYLALISFWQDPLSPLPGAPELPTAFTDPALQASLDSPAVKMMFLDLVTYLPDDILVKIDRACMAVGLEPRAPLLDHRVVEFAWRVPLALKIRLGEGKWLLRRILDQYVPRHLVERPKAGFAIPLDEWLRGPLRDWAESLLAADRLRSGELLDPRPIRCVWQRHCSGGENWGPQLWSVLMFEAWREAQRI